MPFSVSSVFRLWNSRNVETWNNDMEIGDMETWRQRHRDIKRKMEAKTFSLNPFTVCSSCKQKFAVCLFVDEETNGSYLFANELNGRAHLQMHILYVIIIKLQFY
jgi:hypothetical protein